MSINRERLGRRLESTQARTGFFTARKEGFAHMGKGGPFGYAMRGLCLVSVTCLAQPPPWLRKRCENEKATEILGAGGAQRSDRPSRQAALMRHDCPCQPPSKADRTQNRCKNSNMGPAATGRIAEQVGEVVT